MGKELVDICKDEESDCVLISSASDNQGSSDVHTAKSASGESLIEKPEQPAHPISHEPLEDVSEENIMTHPLEITINGTDNCLKEQALPCGDNVDLDSGRVETKRMNKIIQKPLNDKNLDHPVKLASESSTAGSAKSSHTVPHSFAIATDKHASGGNHPSVPNNSSDWKKNSSNSLSSQNQTKKSQSADTPPLASRKPLLPDNMKHYDDEDSCSVASSTAASVKTLKGRVTVASAPTFRCNQRAEKRREFYSKLEEKHQALEAEKNQCEARTKEEREAALKQLRKSMTFKANPMPSFYREGPPPKVELKKLPTTRAKSPKLGRRKSCGDTTSVSQGEKNSNGECGRARHSLSNYKVDNKLQSGTKTRSPVLKDKEGSNKSAKESAKKSLPSKVSEQITADITVQS